MPITMEALCFQERKILNTHSMDYHEGDRLPGWGAAAILAPFTMRWLVRMHYLWSARIDYVLH
jgi:hypothetical protein